MKKYIRHLLFLVVLFVFGYGFSTQIMAAGPVIITDNKCVHYTLTHGVGICNKQCNEDCVVDNRPCEPDDPTLCQQVGVIWGIDGEIEVDPSLNPIINPGGLSDSYIIAGIDLGPTDQAIPRLIRIFFFGGFAAIGMAALSYGIYAMIVISTAMDNAEKFETGMKILKNVILGVIISFGGVVIVQIVSLLAGLQENIFNFYLVPKQGQSVEITQDFADDGPCLPGQDGLINGVPTYTCGPDGKWQ